MNLVEINTLPYASPVKAKAKDGAAFLTGQVGSGISANGYVDITIMDGDVVVRAHSFKFTDVFPFGDRELLEKHLKLINMYYCEEKEKMEEKSSYNEKLLSSIEKFATDEDELLALVAKIKRMKNPGNIIKAVKKWGTFHIDLDAFIKEYFINE